MEDIIEIYQPVYRESSNLPIILIIIGSVLLLATAVFLIYKFIIKKSKPLTPDDYFNQSMELFTNLQGNLNNISSRDFANSSISIYKNYLSNILHIDFLSRTNSELLHLLNITKNSPSDNLKEYLINHIEKSQYGKLEISNQDKQSITKEFVESINSVYHGVKEAEND